MNKKKSIFIFFLSVFFILGLKMAFITDRPIRRAIVTRQGPTWNNSLSKKVVAAVSRYGDWPELMILGTIGFLLARRASSQRWQKIFLCAMLASTVAGGLVNTLRLTTGRTRPRVGEQHWYGPYHAGKWTIGNAELNSFPSGHTATAVAFAVVIFLGNPFWGVIAILVAISVALSRLLLGAHHPSDLIAASFLATVIAWFLSSYVKKYSPLWLDRLVK